MKPHPIPFLSLLTVSLGWILGGPTIAGLPPDGVHQFQLGGVAHRVSPAPGSLAIQRQDPDTRVWSETDFALPEGCPATDAQGNDLGLRFADLNGDGYDDLLLANPDRFLIQLWTKTVRPDLGWTRGWSQFVAAGEGQDPHRPLPSLVGLLVEVRDGRCLVLDPGAAQGPPRFTRTTRELIAIPVPDPLNPSAARATLRVPDGFGVELVAAEPLVEDPVALDWGPDGRLWVVEMGDYPTGLDGRGQPGGVVKFLEDLDGDGIYDRATRFLEGLPFPNGVMPWSQGVLVSAAPDLIYAEDTDGDGRADLRRVLFTGFHPGNQQHLFNGFEWGFDGWVYAANGDSGGTVTSVATGHSLSIQGRDVRFRPDTGEIQTASGQTQFGLRRDDWGHWFGNNNATWLWQVVLPDHYLRRNPRLAVRRVLQLTALDDQATRVFPLSPPAIRPNQPWAQNHVTSASSPTPYRDTLFGPEYTDSIFLAEPVHNLVHRQILRRQGATFTSHRAPEESDSEFLASSDPWFRPVFLRIGPDGALYVADMYRFTLEHPEWISEEMQARLDLRAGADRGRLYRISPTNPTRRSFTPLNRLDDPGLAAALNSPSGWQRDTVQRLLIERGATSVSPLIEPLLGLRHAPAVRLQALATLGTLGTLNSAHLRTALGDPHFAVRREALRLSETFVQRDPTLFADLAARADDHDGAVRFQAAFSLGFWPPDQAEPVLARLVLHPEADEFLRAAVLSSLRPDRPLFAQLNQPAPKTVPLNPALVLKPSSPDRGAVVERYTAAVAGLRGEPARGRQPYLDLCAPCHRLHDVGHAVGPDLAMVGTKPIDWLLTAILDPAQVVEDRYRGWTVHLTSGDEPTGLIAAETSNNIVLRTAGGVDLPLLRDDLQSLDPLPGSLMPDGFEEALNPQAMADLLAWMSQSGSEAE